MRQCVAVDEIEWYPYGENEYVVAVRKERCPAVAQPEGEMCSKHAFLLSQQLQDVAGAEREPVSRSPREDRNQ